MKNITKENDVLDDGNVSKPKENPGYLKILCVLNYISCRHGLVAALGVIAAGASFAESLADIPGMGAVAGNLALWAGLKNLACAAGIYWAIQMWKLNKQGYYIYIGSHGITFLIPVILGFNASVLVFPAAFVAMYGMNVKQMSVLKD